MALSHSAALEAVLFSAGEPLSKKRLAALLDISPIELRDAALALRDHLDGTGLALIEAGEDLELRTAPDASAVVQKLRESELSRDLGKAGLEALAIILYRNGATRGEIDWVRGVNSTAALRSLSLRGLVLRTEDEHDRRRIRYTPTVEALAHLGVSSVRNLPHYDEFAESLAARGDSPVAEAVIESPEEDHEVE
ncbi:MAG: SMC-Scp complex subunit ScpB [Candidatus Pacebacteria bacterium]|nr:SMC-Scp complex subunit ScpB [Candidatus Paceibacterota bacterium]